MANLVTDNDELEFDEDEQRKKQAGQTIGKPIAYGPISPSSAAGARVPSAPAVSTTVPTATPATVPHIAGTISDTKPYQPKSGLNADTGMPPEMPQEMPKPLPQSMTIGSLSIPPKQPTVQESESAFNREFQGAPASVKQPAGKAEYDAERDAISNGPGSQADRDAQLSQYDLNHQRGSAVSARPGSVGTLQRVGLTALGATNIGDALETIGRFGPIGAHARLSTAQGEVNAENENAVRAAQAGNLNAEAEARRNPKPKLLPGDENIRIDQNGNREQAYEMPDGSKQWVREGQSPGLTSGGTIARGPIARGPVPAPVPAPEPATRTTSQAEPMLGGDPGTAGSGQSVGTPQYTYGKGANSTEEEKYQTKYLLNNNIPDTAANRLLAHQEYQGKAPIGSGGASKYNAQVKDALKGSDVDAAAYTVSAGDTVADAKETLAAAQRDAAAQRANKSQERIAGAPAAAEQTKMRHNYGYSTDSSGNVIYTTEAKAADAGTVFEPIPPAEVNKDRQAIGLMGNVQLNASNYRKAVDALPGPISQEHSALMQRILADPKLDENFLAKELSLGAMTSVIAQGERASDWNQLTKPEQDAVTQYLRAKGAVIAYQRALTNQGRTNPEALMVEFDTIPVPFVGSTVADPRFDSFQENIDQVSTRLPNNLPGVPSVKSVREKAEGGKVPAGAKSVIKDASGKVTGYRMSDGTIQR